MSYSIGKRLKQLREESGLQQKDIAKILGVTESAIGHYERGARNLDPESIKKLADFFGVSSDYLLCRTDIKNPYDEFLNTAKEQYGSRGKKQAEELLENIQTMFEGGELPDEDKDEFFRAITEIYFDAKEKNKKYTPKKYRKNNNEE